MGTIIDCFCDLTIMKYICKVKLFNMSVGECEMPLFCIAACFELIITSVVCGCVRWFHMCRPFGDDGVYFYPARKIISSFFFSAVLLTPYLIHWNSPDTWLYAKSFYLILFPSLFTTGFRSYFFGLTREWVRKFILISAIPAILVTGLFVLACIGGNLTGKWHRAAVLLIAAASITLTVTMIIVIRNLVRKIIRHQQEEYSSEEDFPIHFAKGLLALPGAFCIIYIVVFVSDSPTAFGLFNIFVSIVEVIFLLVILHPHKKYCSDRKTSSNVIEDNTSLIDEGGFPELREETSDKQNETLPDYMIDRLEVQIRKAVECGQLFLDPKLNKTVLARHLGTNRTYLSIVFRDRLVSFYSYINTLRIEYASRYEKEHPDANKQEIASSSGFGSTKTYQRIKMLYETGQLH